MYHANYFITQQRVIGHHDVEISVVFLDDPTSSSIQKELSVDGKQINYIATS